jgi:hypothetical protein
VRAANREKLNVDISRILADRWKEMDEDLRSPYRVRAQAQQSEFRRIGHDYKYDKAKDRRTKRADIVTLVNLPIDDLRA